MAKLIQEFVHKNDIEYIAEAVEGQPKQYKIRGVFLEAEVRNKNKRIYPLSIVEREVKRYYDEAILTGNSVGELDHSTSPNIDLGKISHKIEELYMQGNQGIGVAKVLGTPNGKILKTLIDEQVKFGVSTKGVGSLGGGGIVNKDYRLIGVDAVQDPSCQSAMVEGILENREFIIGEDGTFVEIAIDRLEKTLERKYSPELQAIALKMFLKEISNGF